jgi:hypothetical protein
MSEKIQYCRETGKPHTINFDDGLSVGIHRGGVQMTLPLGKSCWSAICKDGKVEVSFKEREQIELLIERLQKLKDLKSNYDRGSHLS